MDLLILVLVLCVIGFIAHVLTTRIPMPPYWASTIQIVALVVLLLYLLARVAPLPNVLP